MKEYQPQTTELLSLGIALLQSEKVYCIKSYVDLISSRMIAEIELEGEIKLVGARLMFPSGNEEKDLNTLELALVKEINVYLKLNDVLKKAKLLV